MAGFMSAKTKRKDLEDVYDEFSELSFNSLARKIRRLVMCTDYVQEKTELVNALIKDRKLSDLPKITQVEQASECCYLHAAEIIWGEHDHVFPLELAHRLKRHLDDNSELVVIKKAGHAVNLEKPNETC